MRKLKLQRGAFFNQSQMNSDVARLQDKYGGIGYVFADVKAENKFLDEPGKLDLVYNITEGDRYRVGRINVEIKGDNPHTQITTVLNRLSLKPGDIVDMRELRDSERRLKASMLFVVDPSKGTPPKIVYSPPDSAGKDKTELARRGDSQTSYYRAPEGGGAGPAGGPALPALPPGERYADLTFEYENPEDLRRDEQGAPPPDGPVTAMEPPLVVRGQYTSEGGWGPDLDRPSPAPAAAAPPADRYSPVAPAYSVPPAAPPYAAPPPGYAVPPPGYMAPPPGYTAPPPGYAAPPPGYAAPGRRQRGRPYRGPRRRGRPPRGPLPRRLSGRARWHKGRPCPALPCLRRARPGPAAVSSLSPGRVLRPCCPRRVPSDPARRSDLRRCHALHVPAPHGRAAPQPRSECRTGGNANRPADVRRGGKLRRGPHRQHRAGRAELRLDRGSPAVGKTSATARPFGGRANDSAWRPHPAPRSSATWPASRSPISSSWPTRPSAWA